MPHIRLAHERRIHLCRHAHSELSQHSYTHTAAHVPADPGTGPRPFRLGGDPERFGRPRPFAIEHLRLDARLDVPAKSIAGTATLRVLRKDPTARVLVLDAVSFEVSKVTANGGDASYRYDGDRLHIELSDKVLARSPVEVAITYRATPARGLYVLSPDEQHPRRPWQAWSQCQDEDARHFIPCHDFPNMKMSTEMLITAPEGWTVLSNGALISREKVQGGAHGGDTKALGASGPGEERWHWKQEAPHVAYLMTLVAGNFSELVADMPELPLRYYVDPGREEDGKRAFGRTPEMLAHFEKVTGVKYPWVKYHQVAVHDFIFGGMENTSCTTMTDRILLDERAMLDNSSDDIVAHELAHQWFGDLVTCRDWSHAWLNEGFATFFEHVDQEKKGGRDEYLYSLKEHGDAYFAEDGGRYRRPIVCNTYANPIDLFDRHLYEKGGWVLHMLRSELGDELFFGGVKRYLEKHRGGLVETTDLLRALEEQSGRSLEGFFDQWVYRAGYPDVEVEASFDAEASLLSVTVRQKQSADAVTPLFKFSLGLAVVTAKGESAHTLAISEGAHTFALPVAKGEAPVRVAVDPNGAVLMRLTQKLPRDYLLDALAKDPRAVVRWRAAEALSRRDEGVVREALAKSVKGDPFWGVRAEAAGALGAMRSDGAFEALAKLVSVEHPKARRAVASALGEFKTEKSAKALTEWLARGDASVLVESETARSAGRTRRPEVFDALVSALSRDSWRDLVRAGAIDGLARLRDPRALPLVDPYASKGPGVATRRAAVAALGELGQNQEKRREVRERLETLLDPNDPYFTPEVLRALVRLQDGAAQGAIASLRERSLDGRVQRYAREAARDLRPKEAPEEVRRLSDALEKLREEQQGLRDELTKLRARVLPEEGAGAAKGATGKTAKKAGAAKKAPAPKKKGPAKKGAGRR